MKTLVVKFIAKLLTAFLRIESLLCKPFGLKPRVVIISRQSNSPTLDISMLSECLEEKKIETVVLTKMVEKGILKMIAYAFHLMCQVYYITTSKVIVIDGYCIAVSSLKKNDRQHIIQMWHALGAIKKFGWQNVDSPDGHGRDVAGSLNMHGNYDYVVAPSKITGRFFSEAFNVPEDKVIFQGLPRIDFLRQTDQDMRSKMIERYPTIKSRKNILYAPTFRKKTEIEIEGLVKNFDFEKCNLILKKHFLDKTDYSWAREYGAIIDDEFSSMEWLRICEGLITDYSAIMFEAAILKREIYVYQQDIDNYEHNVGLNVDLATEAISKYVCTNPETLIKKINASYDNEALELFTRKYIEIEIDGCTDRLCEFIKDLLK